MKFFSLPPATLFVAIALIAASLPLSATTAGEVETLLDAMPADNPEEAARLFGQAIQAGRPLVHNLCDRIYQSAPAMDAHVQFALNGLTTYVARPGNEAERARLARWYEEALRPDGEPEAQRFIMSLLHICGDADSINVLERFARNDTVYSDAIQCITAIGGAPAVASLRALCADDNPDVAEAAMTALIHMGQHPPPYVEASVLGADIRAAAIKPPAPETRAGIGALSRDALGGDALSGPERILALRALVHCVGEDALPELLAAVDDPDPRFRGAALALARDISGVAISQAFSAGLTRFPEPVRPHVVHMLGQRNDATARKAVRDALADSQLETRLAACEVITRNGDLDVLASLIRALRRADTAAEVNAIKDAMLRLPEPDVSDNAVRLLRHAQPMQQAACLDIITARRAEQHLDAVRAHLDDEEARVRRAALDAMGAVGAPEDVQRLFTIMLALSANAEINAARDAIAAIANRTDTGTAAVEQAAVLLEEATAEDASRLLRTLSALGGETALEATKHVAEQSLFGEDANTEIGGAALETLGAWAGPAAAGILLEFIERIEDDDMRLGAVRQLTVSVQRAVSGTSRQLALLEKALVLCQTEEEQHLVKSTIERIRPKEEAT